MIRSIAILSTVVALGFGLPQAARADDNSLLKGFSGPWRGTGAVRTAVNAPQEKLVCRVDGALKASGDALDLSGRCGGERFNGSFTVSLTFNSATGNYTAVWRDSLGSKSPPLTGLRSGNRLVFKVRHNDFESDGRAISTLVVDPQSSRFHIVGRTEPASGSGDFVSADLIFVRG